jgi:hypothetical protein
MTIISGWEQPVEIACDECGFVVETETTDFRAALRMLRKIEWSVRRRDGVWLHFCSLCQPKTTRK